MDDIVERIFTLIFMTKKDKGIFSQLIKTER